MKLTPHVNADISRTCPASPPTDDVANNANATAPKIGIVIPAKTEVDCQKTEFKRYTKIAATTIAQRGPPVRIS